jgi:hypothetical protein
MYKGPKGPLTHLWFLCVAFAKDVKREGTLGLYNSLGFVLLILSHRDMRHDDASVQCYRMQLIRVLKQLIA